MKVGGTEEKSTEWEDLLNQTMKLFMVSGVKIKCSVDFTLSQMAQVFIPVIGTITIHGRDKHKNRVLKF